MIIAGIDTTEWIREFRRNSEALFKGEIPEMPEMSTDKLNEQLKRRP